MVRDLTPFKIYRAIIHHDTQAVIGLLSPVHLKRFNYEYSSDPIAPDVLEGLVREHDESVRTGIEGEELNTICTQHGRPIGYAQRASVHQLGIPHQIVLALIVRKDPQGIETSQPWFMGTRALTKRAYGGRDLPFVGEHATIDDRGDPQTTMIAALNEEVPVNAELLAQNIRHERVNLIDSGLRGMVDSSDPSKGFGNREWVSGFFVYRCPVRYDQLVPDPQEWSQIRGVSGRDVMKNDFFAQYTQDVYAPGKAVPHHGRGVVYPIVGRLMEDHDPVSRSFLDRSDKKEQKLV